MIEWLYQVDVGLFRFLNETLSNPFWDTLLVYLTTLKKSWWIAAGVALFTVYRRKWDGVVIVLLAVISIAIADQIASGFFKPLVARTRPCFALENVRLLVDQSRSFSFASSHAANTMAVFTIIFFFFWKTSEQQRNIDRAFVWTLGVYTLLVGWSRIYVGVHYPSDVLGGFVIGIFAAMVSYGVYSYIMKNWVLFRRQKASPQKN
ncbi:MAG: phosphatase PAP2 family protein [Chloroherpetonaceae bacterium]|nr:phosphatase PAP2 family protein [Chloroherpetonaceae bacterium]